MARGIFTASTVLTAAALNDCFDPPRCRVFNSAAISIPTGTSLTFLTFDTEIADDGGMHSTSVNTGRITIPTGGAGYYMVGGAVNFDPNTTGHRELGIRLNGSDQIASVRMNAVTTGSTGTRVATSTMMPLAAGDYLELGVAQNSGGALNVATTSSISPIFWAVWLAVA